MRLCHCAPEGRACRNYVPQISCLRSGAAPIPRSANNCGEDTRSTIGPKTRLPPIRRRGQDARRPGNAQNVFLFERIAVQGAPSQPSPRVWLFKPSGFDPGGNAMVCAKSTAEGLSYSVRLCGRGLRHAVPALTLLGLCLRLLVPGSAHAAAPINACGGISTDTAWVAANVYVINNCATVVAPGVTLTIQPGTVVKFGGGRDVLLVEGTLQAIG